MGQIPFPLIKMPPATAGYDSRLMDILSGYHAVHLSNDKDFNEKLAWCLEHCQSKFRDLSESKGRTWYFKNQQDAVLFSLKWS